MDDTLTTLIAFVGFLIVFSSLVQSFQEGLKNLFKLKTRVWERFFVDLYQIEFSLKQEESVGGFRKCMMWIKNVIHRADGTDKIAKTTEPKSELSVEKQKKKDSVGEFDIRMKRINDVVCKADDLLKKMKTALYEIKGIDPKAIDANIQLLSKVNIFRDALEDVMGLKLNSLLNIYDRFVKTKIRNFYNSEVLADFLKKYPDLLDELRDRDPSTMKKVQVSCSKLLTEIQDIERTIGDYRLQIEDKIDSWIAKVEEEYKRNMLKWTVIIGAAFVLIFNADTFNIYKYLGVDSKARTTLVQNATENAGKTTTQMQKAKPEKLNEIEKFLEANKAEEAKKLLGSQLQNLEEDFSRYKAKDKIEEVKKLREEVEKISIAEKGEALGLLKRKSGDVSRLYLELQKKSFDYQLEGLTGINLPLGWVADWKNFIAVAVLSNQWFILIVKKIGGLAITIFLITFGAPFWNDILGVLVGITRTSFRKGQEKGQEGKP